MKTYKYILYHNNNVLGILKSNTEINTKVPITYNNKVYSLIALPTACIGVNEYVIPCHVHFICNVGYKWVAECSDGAFEDKSKQIFATKEECYNDMRNSALEKMKWNTEFRQDFDNEEDSIGYEVSFSQNEIVHKSYSGTYTYKIVEEVSI
jgi:hypothetical protein